MVSLTPTPDQVIAAFVSLRDQAQAVAKRHEQELKPFHEGMARCESWLLAYLNESHQEATRTEQGTAYKSTTLSATVDADGGWDRFLAWAVGQALQRALDVVEHGGDEAAAQLSFCASPELAFLIRGVNKTAVKEMMDATGGAVPPGVKTAQIVKVNVRRA